MKMKAAPNIAAKILMPNPVARELQRIVKKLQTLVPWTAHPWHHKFNLLAIGDKSSRRDAPLSISASVLSICASDTVIQ